MASVGQTHKHCPQRTHSSVCRALGKFPFAGVKIRVGQIFAHSPHRLQVSASTKIVGGSINLFSILPPEELEFRLCNHAFIILEKS
jgi:hypothetical protein